MFNLGKKLQTVFFEVLFFKMTLALSLFFILWNSIILFKKWITILEEKISKGTHLGGCWGAFATLFFCPTLSRKPYPSQKLLSIPDHLPNVGLLGASVSPPPRFYNICYWCVTKFHLMGALENTQHSTLNWIYLFHLISIRGLWTILNADNLV